MEKTIKYRKKNIFLSLKQCLLGRINDNDIKFLKKRFSEFETHQYKQINWYKGYAKIIYYNINKQQDNVSNKQWLRIKTLVDNEQSFILGSIDDTYTHNGKKIIYYKYFRYYHKYSILELVSDYYNKIPIFYHLGNGEYTIINNIECIPIIDDCYLRFRTL